MATLILRFPLWGLHSKYNILRQIIQHKSLTTETTEECNDNILSKKKIRNFFSTFFFLRKHSFSFSQQLLRPVFAPAAVPIGHKNPYRSPFFFPIHRGAMSLSRLLSQFSTTLSEKRKKAQYGSIKKGKMRLWHFQLAFLMLINFYFNYFVLGALISELFQLLWCLITTFLQCKMNFFRQNLPKVL